MSKRNTLFDLRAVENHVSVARTKEKLRHNNVEGAFTTIPLKKQGEIEAARSGVTINL